MAPELRRKNPEREHRLGTLLWAIRRRKQIHDDDLSQVDDRLGNTANDPTNILGICYEPIEGWLKTQFKEDSLTVQECDIYYNGARMAYKSCSSYCSDAGNDDSNCIAACINTFTLKMYNFYLT